ncbi:MAG: HIT family protein [Patescibacteria group bacterium]
MSCLFCKIINNEIPSTKIFENDQVVAFLDINPCNSGHVLVVPREHCENLLDISAKNLQEVTAVLPKIAQAVLKSLNYEGFNLSVNNGAVAGQVVPHLHFHIVPRKDGDGHELFQGRSYKDGEMEVVAKKIKQALL